MGSYEVVVIILYIPHLKVTNYLKKMSVSKKMYFKLNICLLVLRRGPRPSGAAPSLAKRPATGRTTTTTDRTYKESIKPHGKGPKPQQSCT